MSTEHCDNEAINIAFSEFTKLEKYLKFEIKDIFKRNNPSWLHLYKTSKLGGKPQDNEVYVEKERLLRQRNDPIDEQSIKRRQEFLRRRASVDEQQQQQQQDRDGLRERRENIQAQLNFMMAEIIRLGEQAQAGHEDTQLKLEEVKADIIYQGTQAMELQKVLAKKILKEIDNVKQQLTEHCLKCTLFTLRGVVECIICFFHILYIIFNFLFRCIRIIHTFLYETGSLAGPWVQDLLHFFLYVTEFGIACILGHLISEFIPDDIDSGFDIGLETWGLFCNVIVNIIYFIMWCICSVVTTITNSNYRSNAAGVMSNMAARTMKTIKDSGIVDIFMKIMYNSSRCTSGHFKNIWEMVKENLGFCKDPKAWGMAADCVYRNMSLPNVTMYIEPFDPLAQQHIIGNWTVSGGAYPIHSDHSNQLTVQTHNSPASKHKSLVSKHKSPGSKHKSPGSIHTIQDRKNLILDRVNKAWDELDEKWDLDPLKKSLDVTFDDIMDILNNEKSKIKESSKYTTEVRIEITKIKKDLIIMSELGQYMFMFFMNLYFLPKETAIDIKKIDSSEAKFQKNAIEAKIKSEKPKKKISERTLKKLNKIMRTKSAEQVSKRKTRKYSADI